MCQLLPIDEIKNLKFTVGKLQEASEFVQTFKT